MLDKFLQDHKDLNILFLCESGSRLYGTDTHLSDHDYKGIYLPTKSQCYLNQIQKSIRLDNNNIGKNTNSDVDIELYSLQYYLQLLKNGDTGALDILHAQSYLQKVKINSLFMYRLYAMRKEFYTTNLKAFVGYCRIQANKYGIKGSRLNDAKTVLDFLGNKPSTNKLCLYWEQLPKGENIKFFNADKDLKREFPIVEVCNRKLQNTVTVGYAYAVISKFYNDYGKRAKQAAKNEGIDWKAISHALRCAYQMKSIYEKGDIIFPLPEAPQLIKVKMGELDYLTQVTPNLESLMDKVEQLCEESKLPNKVNDDFINDLILEQYGL